MFLTLDRTDPTVLAPGRTSDVGQGQRQEKFFYGQSVRRSEGSRTAKGIVGRTEVFTSF